MKILIIDVNCKNSSTGKIVYDLYSEMNKRGHTAAVCYGRGPLINENNIYKFGLDPETYFHALMTRITGYTGIYSPFSTCRLLRFIKKFKPDVVHIHELHGYFVNIVPVINYLKRQNIRTIWTFHCEFMYTGKCGYAYECNKWKTECKKCPQKREYPSSYLFDFTKQMYREKTGLMEDFENLTIATVSTWLGKRVKESYLKDKRILTVYNGIDINVFSPKNYEHIKKKHGLTDESIVLSVAPDIMSHRKGGRRVVALAKEMKDERVKFILIGVTDLSETFDDNIIPIGRTNNQEELAEYYSMADFTLLTSKAETFSLVCAESLACGTPLIGFNAGAPEEVAPEGYGLFVPYGDIDSLCNNIRMLLDNQIVLKNGDECVTFCRERYDMTNMVRNYLSLYEENQ